LRRDSDYSRSPRPGARHIVAAYGSRTADGGVTGRSSRATRREGTSSHFRLSPARHRTPKRLTTPHARARSTMG
jgi:hypothetical protein